MPEPAVCMVLMLRYGFRLTDIQAMTPEILRWIVSLPAEGR